MILYLYQSKKNIWRNVKKKKMNIDHRFIAFRKLKKKKLKLYKFIFLSVL